MNKISFPRYDVDGNKLEQEALESWYAATLPIKAEIYYRLFHDVTATTYKEKKLLKHLKGYLHEILLLKPSRMQWYTAAINKVYGGVLVHSPNGRRCSTTFGEQLLNAFNYKNYRHSCLVELAKKLNVKTCPYCNMSFTLYAEQSHPGKRKASIVEKFTRLQFDHFYDKMSYPMLSMSLYNLIPSCPTCNQGKSAHALPVIFHPYMNDIHSLFAFEVSEPIAGYTGDDMPDYVDVKLNWKPFVTQKDGDAFENTFHLAAMYSRHGDVVRDTFYKAYEHPYYANPSNFTFLSAEDAKYLERLWYGNYMDEKDIHRRPLAKFTQDVRKQAEMSTLKLSDLME